MIQMSLLGSTLFSRRESRVNNKKIVIEEFCLKSTINIHRRWVSFIRENMYAKIEVVFDQENRGYMRKSLILEDPVLWIEPSITLALEFTDCSKSKTARILVFCYHPERLLRTHQGTQPSA